MRQSSSSSMGQIIGMVNAVWAKNQAHLCLWVPWSSDFSPDEAPLTNVVVPVEMQNVPYLLSNNRSLIRIAMAIGKTISMSLETKRKYKFQEAKMYVKVDLPKRLPHAVVLVSPMGGRFL
ncbi:hypothetical protein IGI04_026540 [Brassica rapa subsp. trilocularis]|uniref:Uncharacterized protein n=1 Tax=Brassica rapa subsp. trilocularis TaxID=1813537 RepID=A0ABQ7KWC7_BRACM|nr:hypothetical protein IGI04_026540 [Brassica rapa subsp. trilocularis]